MIPKEAICTLLGQFINKIVEFKIFKYSPGPFLMKIFAKRNDMIKKVSV